MLVRVQRGTGTGAHGLSGAEERVVALLSSWGEGEFHLPGLALVNVNVPEKTTTRQVDALIFTPSGLIVVEVKGFTRAQPGTLTVPPNGPWTVNGEPAAVHTLTGLTPSDQVKAGVYAAKAALAGIDGAGGSFVTGLVVLVPQGRGLTLGDTDRAGRGIRVTVATRKDLRWVMHRHNDRPVVWSADAVLSACRSLSLEHLAPDRSALLAEGFPEQFPAPTSRPVPPLREPPVPARPRSRTPARTDKAPAGAWSPRSPGLPGKPPPDPLTPPPAAPAPKPERSRPSPTHPPSAKPALRPVARPARRRRIPWGLLIVLTVLCSLGITAAILVDQMFAGR